MKKFTKLAMVAAVAAATSFSAAATTVTEFFYSQSAGLTDPIYENSARYNFTQSAYIADPAYPAGTFSTLSWVGDFAPNPPSSLTVNTYTSSSAGVEVSGNGNSSWEEGEVWRITNLHHINNEIFPNANSTYNDPLWIANIVANLRIFSDAVGGTVAHSELGSTNTIQFTETPNNNCAPPNPHGTTCDDIYTDLTIAAFAPTFFFYNGVQYELDFGLEAGAGAIIQITDFLRVYTAETFPGESDIYVTMAWHAVPEPGSLALAGLGLTALAALRRRKSLVV